LEDGSRLVVLPADDRGCFWRRQSLADPPGLVDFPNLGVSEARSWGKTMEKTHQKGGVSKSDVYIMLNLQKPRNPRNCQPTACYQDVFVAEKVGVSGCFD
jgi:hypothetical protein